MYIVVLFHQAVIGRYYTMEIWLRKIFQERYTIFLY